MSCALRLAITAFASLLLAGCFGYQLGGAKPSALAGVDSIAVPMFTNDTLEPRVGVLATNATVSALAADGTYKIKSKAEAAAVLEASVTKIDYIQIRANRLDTLRPEELENIVTVEWKLMDSQSGRMLDSGAALGTRRVVLCTEARTSRTNALPDAVENAARSIASQLGDGF